MVVRLFQLLSSFVFVVFVAVVVVLQTCCPEDVKDDHGWTVLMWGALAGSIDICAAWLNQPTAAPFSASNGSSGNHSTSLGHKFLFG